MVIYNFIKYLILSYRYNKILNKVYREENILPNLSKILGCELKQDWIGRVYAVINPYIKDGQYDETTVLYEVGSDKPSTIAVEEYVMKRLIQSSQFIRANNLFDLLTYSIEKIDDYGNCLFKMYPIPYVDLKRYTRKFLIIYIPLIILIIVGTCLL